VRRRRSAIPIALAALLLCAAALLTWLADDRAVMPERIQVEIPSYPRPKEWERMEQRATLRPLQPVTLPDGQVPPRLPERIDPLYAALPGSGSALVLEANAIRHGRLGEVLLACQEQRQREGMERLKAEVGIDPLKDVDRVAFDGPVMAVSGFFQSARLAGAGLAPRGEEGGATLWAAEGRGPPDVALWRGQLLLLGPPEELRAAVARLEGRAPPSKPALEPNETYGEAYGVFSGDELQRMLGGAEPLAARLAGLAQEVRFHVDAMQAIAARVNVSGADPVGLADAAKSIGAALAVARAKAALDGDQDLSELLEQARVVPSSRGFAVEVAVPEETLARWLAFCRERAAHPPSVPAPVVVPVRIEDDGAGEVEPPQEGAR
jgi:hypothetical protein